MIGGGLGNFASGEWTDDTTMAWCILDDAASGVDLRSDEALTSISRHFRDWLESGPTDIGIQTGNVLRSSVPNPTARFGTIDPHVQRLRRTSRASRSTTSAY